MRWEGLGQGGGQLPSSWLHAHYFDGFNALFRIENALRVFAYIVLKNALSSEYVGCKAAEGKSIAEISRQRRSQDQAYGYLAYQSECPFLYLGTGELVELMLSEGLWKHFGPYFDGDKGVISVKLGELVKIRNSLAHFRPLKPGDVEYAKEIASQLLLKVEGVIGEIYSCHRPVAGSLRDRWVQAVEPTSFTHSKLDLRESPAGKWVAIQLEYEAPVWAVDAHASWLNCSVCRLDAAATARALDCVKAWAIAFYEQVRAKGTLDDGQPEFSKQLTMVLSRSSLEDHWDAIMDQLRIMQDRVDSETTGVSSGNLVRGELVEPRYVFARKDDGGASWTVHSSNLESPAQANDPVEYWGTLSSWGVPSFEYLTAVSRYPWMTVDISRDWFSLA